MATPIKRIEKEFLLKAIFDEQIPLMYIKGQTQYVLTLEKPAAKGQLFLKTDRRIDGLRVRKKLNLIFDYRGQVIMFSIQVIDFTEEHITATEPEFLYKNLDRSYSRVSTPDDLHVYFGFLEDRYSLPYPKILEYEIDTTTDFSENLDPQNFKNLTDKISAVLKGFTSGHKILIFKGQKPTAVEENLLVETGKAFFLPSTKGAFPDEDLFPGKKLITEDIFKRYLESTGVNHRFLDEACARYIERKLTSGIISDLWVPILFHEYVIGYIHIWIDQTKEDILPFNDVVLDNLLHFAKAIAYSLKINGFFEAGKIKREPFEVKIIDISASGLLFTQPTSEFYTALKPDIELGLLLKTTQRSINARAKIVRRYKDKDQGYFGCRFMVMAPEDLRFLFEYIYGKTLTNKDASFITGQV